MDSVPNTLIDQRQSLPSRRQPRKAAPETHGLAKVEGGFPHSEIHGSMPVRGSPWLIAAYHVLHRLSAPRHPPDTLKTLDRSHYRCPAPNPCGVRSRSHRRVAVPRRYGPAIKTYAFFRTCPGREAVKLPVISPAGPCGPRGGVDPSVGATRQASPVARPEPHGRTHSLFTMSKNTPLAPGPGRCASRTEPVANGCLRTMAMGL